MGFPDIFVRLGNARRRRNVPPSSPMNFHVVAVDAVQRAAYIGGGPHLPNEVLSFWKE
jgi:hypothetical protein